MDGGAVKPNDALSMLAAVSAAEVSGVFVSLTTIFKLLRI
jgi:hypothetical protein